MIPIELAIFLIAACIFVAIIWGKMILIWRDVMLKRNEQIKKDMDRLEEIKKELKKRQKRGSEQPLTNG